MLAPIFNKPPERFGPLFIASAPVGPRKRVRKTEPAKFPHALDVAVRKMSDPTPMRFCWRALACQRIAMPAWWKTAFDPCVCEQSELALFDPLGVADRITFGPVKLPEQLPELCAIRWPEEKKRRSIAPMIQVPFWFGKGWIRNQLSERVIRPWSGWASTLEEAGPELQCVDRAKHNPPQTQVPDHVQRRFHPGHTTRIGQHSDSFTVHLAGHPMPAHFHFTLND